MEKMCKNCRHYKQTSEFFGRCDCRNMNMYYKQICGKYLEGKKKNG